MGFVAISTLVISGISFCTPTSAKPASRALFLSVSGVSNAASGSANNELPSRSTARSEPLRQSDLYRTSVDELDLGLVGCAVGAPFAVLVAEDVLASGLRLISEF